MNARLLVLLALEWLVASAWADGCFVFKWDKKGDINEPEQKAVILHHEGREDLLLQVKFAGPLEEFGWLIPVPAKPTVERGSMEAFYELSELTQRELGMNRSVTMMGGANAGAGEKKVKVVEIKTVGAYEVAVLAASDAGSLDGWLKQNGYAIPGGKRGSDVVSDYIRRGWFFVAVKIGFGAGSGVALKAQPTSRTQAKLAAGELHPLLISFDSERCVFPLKISSVAGKPSLVSLYVLSDEPLLSRVAFEDGRKTIEKLLRDMEEGKSKGSPRRDASVENMRIMQLQSALIREDQERGVAKADLRIPWVNELREIVRESPAPAEERALDEGVYDWGIFLWQQMAVGADQIKRASKSVPRLKGRGWNLTRVTRTFAPAEMEDLEFEPAIPVLAKELAGAMGPQTALLLARMGRDGASALIEGCKSADARARTNGARGLMRVKDERAAAALLPLLKDAEPAVRLNALYAAGAHWDETFFEPMIALFGDPHREIREQAAQIVGAKMPGKALEFAEMFSDPDPRARVIALHALAQSKTEMVGPERLGPLLKDVDQDVQRAALHTILRLKTAVAREEMMNVLKSSRMGNVMMALQILNGNGSNLMMPGQDVTRSLTSEEAAPLAGHRLAEARLLGLRVLRRNADAKAIELALPLLRDGNGVVRSRAFAAMKEMTGENLSETEAKVWEEWWRAKNSAR